MEYNYLDRILLHDVKQASLFYPSKEGKKKIMEYLNLANQQFDSGKKRGEQIGYQLNALARYAAWSAECQSLTVEELEDSKTRFVQELTQLFQASLSKRIDETIEFFDGEKLKWPEWRSDFSVERLEQELSLSCPSALRKVYRALNDGLITSLRFDLSSLVSHYVADKPFELASHDYDPITELGVYQLSQNEYLDDKTWCFAFRCSEIYIALLSVDDMGIVHITYSDHCRGYFKKKIADRLEDLFDWDLAIKQTEAHECQEPNTAPKTPLLSSLRSAPTIGELLPDNCFMPIDRDELLHVENIKRFIGECIEKLTKGRVSTEGFALEKIHGDYYRVYLTICDRLRSLAVSDLVGITTFELVFAINAIFDEQDDMPDRFVFVDDSSDCDNLFVLFSSVSEQLLLEQATYQVEYLRRKKSNFSEMQYDIYLPKFGADFSLVLRHIQQHFHDSGIAFELYQLDEYHSLIDCNNGFTFDICLNKSTRCITNFFNQKISEEDQKLIKKFSARVELWANNKSKLEHRNKMEALASSLEESLDVRVFNVWNGCFI